MAEHVARNGLEFEATVKQKNVGNPQFAFLIGGEGSEYYQQLLQAHRTAQLSASGGATAVAASTAVAGAAAHTAQGMDLAELAARWPEPQVVALGPEGDRQLGEIVGSLEHIASRDAIRTGRTWVEANAGAARAIAGNLMKRIVYLPTCAHRLHMLFLLHDVLQTEVSKQEATRPLAAAFKPYLVWMLRPSYQLAQSQSPNGDESVKILKLLALWAERGILEAREAEEVKAIVTAKDLPSAAPKSAAVAAAALSAQAPGYTAGLLQQVGAQLRPGLPGAQGQSSNVLGILQQLPGLCRPPGALQALPGFTGVIRPALPAMSLPAQGGQTPETVPVGVMSMMLKQVSKRGKDLHTAFVPYKPLDPLYTPQTLPPVAPPTARLMERLAEYYDALGIDPSKEGRSAALALLAPPSSTQESLPVAAPSEPTAAERVAPQAIALPPPEPAADTEGSEGRREPAPGTAAGEKGEPTGTSERREKARRVMCASGSRSRSRSRSASEGRTAAAAAALGAAIPPASSLGPTDGAGSAETVEAPCTRAIQAID